MQILALIRKNNKNRGYRDHRYRYRFDRYWYRFGSGGRYRYQFGRYRYHFASASVVPVPLQRGTDTGFRICPEMAEFTIFHALFFQKSLIFHSSSKINMEPLQTTLQTLLISQRIQGFIPKFTQLYKTLEL